MDSYLLSGRQKGALTHRKHADYEIDIAIKNKTYFGFRLIVGHAEWKGTLRQVTVLCKCGKTEVVTYSALKTKIKLNKMRQCVECGRKAISGENNKNYSGGGVRSGSAATAIKLHRIHNSSCIICGSINNLHVDHIKPISKYPELSACASNLQTLCSKCHANKSIDDGMPHVAAMLLNGTKTSQVRIECNYCKKPMLSHATRKHPERFCSRSCHWSSKRNPSIGSITELTKEYESGGATIAYLSNKYDLSVDSVRTHLYNCFNKIQLLDIANANRAKAKKKPEARIKAAIKSTGRSNKLDTKKVEQIKLLLLSGNNQSKIADSFNVCAATVGHIASGRNWSWVAV